MLYSDLKLTVAPRIGVYVPGRLNPNDYYGLRIYLIASAVIFLCKLNKSRKVANLKFRAAQTSLFKIAEFANQKQVRKLSMTS